ncbi:MAG: iron ABC transporter substrate-binding protein [Bacillota bacterium]
MGVARRQRLFSVLASLVLAAVLLAACGGPGQQPGGASGGGSGGAAETSEDAGEAAEPASTEPARVVVYSGRNENLIGPLLERFQQATGIQVEVRYGSTSEMAATLLEEGQRSPADVFLAQDAGALGAVAREGLLRPLPADLLDRVDQRFRSPDGLWVGVSGRARTLVYNPERLAESDLPRSIFDLTDPKWRGRLGWAPTNASLQAFVTAMRVVYGDDETRRWLEGFIANEPRVYPNNAAQVEAVAAGEIDLGLVNHYYLYQLKAQYGEDYPAANYYLPDGDIGALINVAGVGVLQTAPNPEAAMRLVDFLLSEEAQRYFAEQTYEYPLISGVETGAGLPPIEGLASPDIDLSDLWDLEGTLELLREVGAL